jgi:hypothetical protein
MRDTTEGSGAVPFRPWVLTDTKGMVLDASDDVDALVNVARRSFIGRNLFIFFDRDRELIAKVALAATRAPATLATRLRPRDRKPTPVRVFIHAVREGGANMPLLRWGFESSGESQDRAGPATSQTEGLQRSPAETA